MSAQLMPSRQSSLVNFVSPGHFLTQDAKGRLHLSECPLCALDPDRESYEFDHKEARDAHFLNEHDADDIGRPMAELLPKAGGRR